MHLLLLQPDARMPKRRMLRLNLLEPLKNLVLSAPRNISDKRRCWCRNKRNLRQQHHLEEAFHFLSSGDKEQKTKKIVVLSPSISERSYRMHRTDDRTRHSVTSMKKEISTSSISFSFRGDERAEKRKEVKDIV